MLVLWLGLSEGLRGVVLQVVGVRSCASRVGAQRHRLPALGTTVLLSALASLRVLGSRSRGLGISALGIGGEVPRPSVFGLFVQWGPHDFVPIGRFGAIRQCSVLGMGPLLPVFVGLGLLLAGVACVVGSLGAFGPSWFRRVPAS